MNHDKVINKLRGFNYAAGILTNQQNDPLCSECAAFARTADAIVDGFLKFENANSSEKKKLAEEFSMIFMDVKDKISVIQMPDDPVRQKKAGNCMLPKGVCFTKEIMTFMGKIV